MEVAIPEVASKDPAFISYLLSPDLDHDCYFVVGNETLGQQPERIGVVKKMLLAHSLVLRTQLQESKIAQKGDVLVDDLYPETFKNLLRYVYGHDNTSVLNFDEADNLLYVAEKYLMTQLKDKLSLRLLRLLTPDKICKLLNNPACFTALNLNSHITKILKFETSKVLESPSFFQLSSSALVKILEQNALNVPEIELWRAALKWARHKAHSEDGKVLRETLSSPLKHIRICTMDLEDFCEEVAPTNILTCTEVALVCLSKGRNERQLGLKEVSNEIQPRAIVDQQCEITRLNHLFWMADQFRFFTKGQSVELQPLKFCARHLNKEIVEKIWDFKFIIRIQEIDYMNVPIGEPIKITSNLKANQKEVIYVPVVFKGENVKLLPNSYYEITVWFQQTDESSIICSNGKITLYCAGKPYCIHSFVSLNYKVVDNSCDN